jgi:hypothetical protein
VKKVVSNFYDLYIGDIAFLATILGMESSEGSWCLLCATGAKDFNCNSEDCVRKQRTIQTMYTRLLQYLHKARNSQSVNNVDGVNNAQQLIPVDPTIILVPILHCPMGLVDKVLSSFLEYTWRKVLLLPPEDDFIRKELQETCERLASAIGILQTKKEVYEQSKMPENKEELKRVQGEKNKAVCTIVIPRGCDCRRKEAMIRTGVVNELAQVASDL